MLHSGESFSSILLVTWVCTVQIKVASILALWNLERFTVISLPVDRGPDALRPGTVTGTADGT